MKVDLLSKASGLSDEHHGALLMEEERSHWHLAPSRITSALRRVTESLFASVAGSTPLCLVKWTNQTSYCIHQLCLWTSHASDEDKSYEAKTGEGASTSDYK